MSYLAPSKPQAPSETLADTLLRIMVEIALKQDDPAEREAMLEILRKDGWL